MPVHTIASAVMRWRSLRPGPLRFTPFGLAAAGGLITSMAFARRCAKRTGIDPDLAWNAGLFAIFSCFLASRLLLALQSPAAFAHYPLLLLGLPSLTFGGMALAALMVWIYLRRKHLSLLRMLDAFAAPAALLAAFLELGHWLDGSEQGMPTQLSWGVAVAGTPGDVRLHPVALYGVVLALALVYGLWRELPLPLTARPGRRSAPQQGRVACFGLIGGGLAAFVLDMFSAPTATPLNAWLEPGQWIALAAMVSGTLLWATLPAGILQAAPPDEAPLPPTQPLHLEVH